jgi:hypothetical protein
MAVESVGTFISQYPHAQGVAGAIARNTALDHLEASGALARALGQTEQAPIRLADVEGKPTCGFRARGESTTQPGERQPLVDTAAEALRLVRRQRSGVDIAKLRNGGKPRARHGIAPASRAAGTLRLRSASGASRASIGVARISVASLSTAHAAEQTKATHAKATHANRKPHSHLCSLLAHTGGSVVQDPATYTPSVTPGAAEQVARARPESSEVPVPPCAGRAGSLNGRFFELGQATGGASPAVS